MSVAGLEEASKLRECKTNIKFQCSYPGLTSEVAVNGPGESLIAGIRRPPGERKQWHRKAVLNQACDYVLADSDQGGHRPVGRGRSRRCIIRPQAGHNT